MVRRTFFVKAIWDEEAEVFYAESDIIGLNIETDTIEEFEQVILEEAVDLIVQNHMDADDLENTPIRNIVPAILWQRPDKVPEPNLCG